MGGCVFDHVIRTIQTIKFNEEHSHGSLVALAIAIIAIFAAVNFNKVYIIIQCKSKIIQLNG